MEERGAFSIPYTPFVGPRQAGKKLRCTQRSRLPNASFEQINFPNQAAFWYISRRCGIRIGFSLVPLARNVEPEGANDED